MSEAIADRHNALVIAPTGSGKTLAAFLHAIDQLMTTPRPAERDDALPGRSTSAR